MKTHFPIKKKKKYLAYFMFVSSILRDQHKTLDLPLIQKGSIQKLKGHSRAFCFLEYENTSKLIVLLHQN